MIQRAEGAAFAVLAAVVFVELGFAWWWLAALFLVFDVSAAGYAFGPVAGARLYNAAHTFAVPALVGAYALVTGQEWGLFLAPLWCFHIGVDRAVGYGLKEPAGFGVTHLDARS